MLTLRQAADQLAMTPDTLRQAIGRGVLKAKKVDQVAQHPIWMVAEEEIERYRREHRRVTR